MSVIFCIGMAAAFLANMSGLMIKIKYHLKLTNKRIKPFDCEGCLAWWMGIVAYWQNPWPIDSFIAYTIAPAGASAIVAIFVVAIFNRIR